MPQVCSELMKLISVHILGFHHRLDEIFLLLQVAVEFSPSLRPSGHGSIPRVVAGPPPPLLQTLVAPEFCFKPLSRGIAGAPPILLTGMLRNSKQADTLRFHEGECAKYRKKMRVQQAVNPEASIAQERGLGFKV